MSEVLIAEMNDSYDNESFIYLSNGKYIFEIGNKSFFGEDLDLLIETIEKVFPSIYITYYSIPSEKFKPLMKYQ